MAAKRRPVKTSSPLEKRKQALEEQQEKLRKKQEQAERVIRNAPKIKEQHEQRKKDELRELSASGSRFDGPSTVTDKRIYVHVKGGTAAKRPGVLKAAQRQARIKFFGLLCGLGLLVMWLYSVWRW